MGECWKGECERFMDGKKLENSFLGDDNVVWNEWQKNEVSGRLEIKVNHSAKGDLRAKLLKDLNVFQEHVRIKRVQSNAFEFDKKDKDLSLLHFDFAMAYSCAYQNEIQSALWSRRSVNLFTAIFYNGKEKPTPYLVVTNCLKIKMPYSNLLLIC